MFPHVTQSYLFSVSCCASSDNSSLFSILSITAFLFWHEFPRAGWEGNQVLLLMLHPDLSSFSDLIPVYLTSLVLIPSSGVELFPHQLHCLSEDRGRVSAPQWFQGLRPKGWLSASPTVLPMMLHGPLKVVLW